MSKLLLFTGSGLGNIIQSTPCIKALQSIGYQIDIVTWISPEIKTHLMPFVESIPDTKCYDMSTDLPFLKLYEYSKICFLKLKPPEPVINYFNLRSYDTLCEPDYPENGTMNEVEMNMLLAQELGYKGQIPATFCPYKEIDLPEYDYVFATNCNPSSFWEIKKWDKFTKLGKELQERGYSVCVIDNYDNQVTGVDDYTYDLDILQKNGLIKKSKNVISIDTVFAHAATALNKNTFVLFGPTSIIKCKPWGNKVTIITNQTNNKGRQRWQGYMNYWAEYKDEYDMTKISIDQVLERLHIK